MSDQISDFTNTVTDFTQSYYMWMCKPVPGSLSVDYKVTFADLKANILSGAYSANQSLDATSQPTFANITDTGLTASQLIATDANKKLVSLSVLSYPSLAELAYVKGATSNIQNQLTALNNAQPDQGVNTTSSPTFAGLTVSTNALSAKTAKFGDGGTANYSEFEADGTLKFNGTATCFLDVVIPILYKGGAGEAALDTLVGGIKNLQFDVNKFTYFDNAEAPHDYKEGSEIELHLHWTVKTALVEGDKVNWQLEFAMANVNNGTNTDVLFCDPANPTVFGTKTITKEYISPVGGTPAGTNIYTSIATISATDMANIKIGAGFIGVLTRISKTAGGTEAGNGKVFGLNLGIHYEVDTIGSRQRGSK